DPLGQDRLQPEDVLDVLAAHRRDHVPAPGDQRHQPLAAEGEQRLADRGPAHAERGRRFVARHEVPGPDLPAHDPGADVVRALLGELRALGQSSRGHTATSLPGSGPSGGRQPLVEIKYIHIVHRFPRGGGRMATCLPIPLPTAPPTVPPSAPSAATTSCWSPSTVPRRATPSTARSAPCSVARCTRPTRTPRSGRPCSPARATSRSARAPTSRPSPRGRISSPRRTANGASPE